MPSVLSQSIREQQSCQLSTTAPDVVETRLWLEEHAWLYGVLKSPLNQAPSFRLPDLISASVSAVLDLPDGQQTLFSYLGTQLVLRDPATVRRREAMWRQQYERLQALQRSPANQHPNPKFQLDQFTTAAVALCREADASGQSLLRFARLNMAQRAQHNAQHHAMQASS
ncbi:hypothetical protein [Roseateles flavus]|uniref:TIGR02444 family protein n=1 Tax=Roseateles flavus TaxID=3149041 RepID=A0ABV0GKL1_9BURK